MNTVWVSCEGENPADQENIGPVDYFPIRGFPGYFYPYQNSEGYLSPLVAIHFRRPQRKYNTTLLIQLFSNRLRIRKNTNFLNFPIFMHSS